jgi:hypothetical protein
MSDRKPIVSWQNATHSAELTRPFDFGTIDAGDKSNVVTVNIWNNKGGNTDVATMEECTITAVDRDGGTGDTIGNIVPSVRDRWFHAQVDSLGEDDLEDESSRIGRESSKEIGTTGSTLHKTSDSATTWAASTAYNVGDAVKPAVSNGRFYVCTKAGTSDTTAPTWITDVGDTVYDGTVEWEVKSINNTPALGEILGIANYGLAANSAGNFTTISFQIDVPQNADSGRQDAKFRTSFKYV